MLLLTMLGRRKQERMPAVGRKQVRGGLPAMIAACDDDPEYIYNEWLRCGIEARVSELSSSQRDLVREKQLEWIAALADDEIVVAESGSNPVFEEIK